jgi:cytochrome c peroxidase
MGKILFGVHVPGAARWLIVRLLFTCVLMERAIPAAETPSTLLEPPAAAPQEPMTPIPLALALDPPRVALGERLFDDGRAPTLEGAVDTMARVQLGRTITPEEIGLIVQFLQTLTGDYHGRPVATSGQEPRDGSE